MRLVLVDPVILSPEGYRSRSEHQRTVSETGGHPIARRRNHFDDVQSMIDNLADRGSFGLWDQQVLQDYCQHGLLPNPEGTGLVLACPPEVEATIYMGTAGNDIHELVRQVDIPVTILRARPRDADRNVMDFSASPTWPELADEFPNGTDVFLPELNSLHTHAGPGPDCALPAWRLIAAQRTDGCVRTDRFRVNTDMDQRGSVLGEGFLQQVRELSRCRDACAEHAVAVGKPGKVRVKQIGCRDAFGVVAFLMHADGAIHTVVDCQNDDVGTELTGRAELCDSHLQAAVAGETDHRPPREAQFGSHCCR